ncbi:MAG: hypothetical protein HZA46_07825 [Planctomycetales bacterium]|nr:hypothetical protein [Planctomycetales bacterium]
MKPKTKVMLFVEMSSASPSQRVQFRDEMRGRDWLPVPKRADTFCTSFVGRAEDSEIVRASEADAELAADASGVKDWTGTCVLSG